MAERALLNVASAYDTLNEALAMAAEAGLHFEANFAMPRLKAIEGCYSQNVIEGLKMQYLNIGGNV